MAQAPYDAIVIGSGAGGGACAWAMAGRGLAVLLLEAGPEYSPEKDYRLHTDEWELDGFPDKVETLTRQRYARMQDLEERWDHLRSWNHQRGPFNPTRRRGFRGYRHVVGLGGSTLHYTGEAHRLNPAAMQMRTRFGVAADWPVSYAELEPFYLRAEQVVGVAGPAADQLRPRSAPYPLDAHRLSYASTKLAAGAKSLGLGWVANPLAALSAPYDGRPGCNYCSNCTRGCPRRDKGSVDVTFIAKARATGRCEIRTLSEVVRLVAGTKDRVAAVEYADAAGALHRVRGRAVIVACGAVESPRLLFNSAGEHAPQGLGNESGALGKHFMETSHWTSVGIHAEPLGSYRGLPSDSICWDYNAPDAIPGVVGGCRFSPGTTESGLAGPVAYARRIVGGWGHDHHERMRNLFGRALALGAIGESLPNEGTFVDLDSERRDAHGLPIARIHSHLDEQALSRLTFMRNTARAILEASGAAEIVEEQGNYDAFDSTHVFGTCRMGVDPADSVVDRDCRSHRWRNLFVTDASVFPSSGGGESPALTIEALAIRAGEHIADLAGRREL
jgi:choline dehydrogenase-like flavoprotein